jgi:hypothetical protein
MEHASNNESKEGERYDLIQDPGHCAIYEIAPVGALNKNAYPCNIYSINNQHKHSHEGGYLDEICKKKSRHLPAFHHAGSRTF